MNTFFNVLLFIKGDNISSYGHELNFIVNKKDMPKVKIINFFNKFFDRSLLILILYLIIHFLIRIYSSDTFQVDDADEIIYGQKISLGYQLTQPPLYTWLSWIFFQIFGANLFSISLLKYLLIALTFVLVRENIKLLITDRSIRKIAFFSFLLMPAFAWHMHQGFTHTILLAFSIMMTLNASINLIRLNSVYIYIYLGLSISIGILSKYSFILFLIPLTLSALSIQEYREKILCRKFLITLAVIFLILLPHFLWILERIDYASAAIDSKLKISSDLPFGTHFDSFFALYLNLFTFISPFIFFIIYIFAKKPFLMFNYPENAPQLLLRNFYIWVLILSFVLFFYQIPHIKLRWLHPIMMAFPIFISIFLDKENQITKKTMDSYMISVIFISILIISIRLFSSSYGPKYGINGRINIPIFQTLNQIEVISEKSELKTYDKFLGSHLLAYFPENSIIINNLKFEKSNGSSCVEIWDDDDKRFLPKDDEELNKIETKIYAFSYNIFYKVRNTSCHQD